LIVKCHAGCGQEVVIRALRDRGLWPAPEDRPHRLARQRNGKVVAIYDYRDETGAPLFQVVRKEPKAFRQRRPDGRGGWISNLDGVRRVLYRVPELLAAPKDAPVFIVEGEKDADRLAALGLVATTNPGGAGKWRPEYNEPLRGRRVVILPDNDDQGRTHTQNVAQSLYGIAAEVRILGLPRLPPKGDVSDWLDAGGTPEELERLAAVAPLWSSPSAVDLSTLLECISAYIRKYFVLSPAELVAIPLWSVHDWAIEAADVTPYLAITSPEKRSGKSNLLKALSLLARRPLLVADISEAALFRSIKDDGRGRATVFIDEADAVFTPKNPHDALRAILNAGHERGAFVRRMVGEGSNQQPVDFDVFGAKCIAAIGRLPDTIADRSIPIRMKRRARHETIAKFRLREVRAGAGLIRSILERYVTPAVIEELAAAGPKTPIPGELDDRAQDGWEGLLAIADRAGGDWPQRARAAAIELHGNALAREETAGELTLNAIRDLFVERKADRMSTADILRGLIERDDGPWAEWWGKDVEAGKTKGPASRLRNLLRRFDVAPQQLWIDGAKVRGYLWEDLQDAFSRYLDLQEGSPDSPLPLHVTSKTVGTVDPAPDAGKTAISGTVGLPFEKSSNPAPDAGSTVLPSLEAQREGGEAPGGVTVTLLASPPEPAGDARRKSSARTCVRPASSLSLEVLERLENEGALSVSPCPCCKRRRFWRTVHRQVVCATCHPPASPALVAEWIGREPLAPADDGRRVILLRLGENLGWPKFEYKPGVSIMAGEEHWQGFAAAAGDAEIEIALRALEHLDE
jgi:hypothetical protein